MVVTAAVSTVAIVVTMVVTAAVVTTTAIVSTLGLRFRRGLVVLGLVVVAVVAIVALLTDLVVVAGADHIIVLNESSLRRILKSYFDYYQHSRTHLSLAKDAPEP